jgi:T-complex protein 1 subunit alpha
MCPAHTDPLFPSLFPQVNPETGKAFYPIKSVGILKQHGGSAKDSTLINGYTIAGGRAAQGMPRIVRGAKIALLDIDLRKTKMAMGVGACHAPSHSPLLLEVI